MSNWTDFEAYEDDVETVLENTHVEPDNVKPVAGWYNEEEEVAVLLEFGVRDYRLFIENEGRVLRVLSHKDNALGDARRRLNDY